MRLLKTALSLFVWGSALASIATAQSTNGTISGRVLDSSGGALPGVTVTVESPNLQAARTAVTSGNGDYQFPLLPSGTYAVTFELQVSRRRCAAWVLPRRKWFRSM